MNSCLSLFRLVSYSEPLITSLLRQLKSVACRLFWRHLISSFYVESSVSTSPHLHSFPGPLYHIPSPRRLYSTMCRLPRFIARQLYFPTRPLFHGGCSLTTQYHILVPSAVVSAVVSNNASSPALPLRQLSSTMHRIPPAVVPINASYHCSAAVVFNNALSYPSSHGGWLFNHALSIPRWLLSNNALSYPLSGCLQRIVISQFPQRLFFNNASSSQLPLVAVLQQCVVTPSFPRRWSTQQCVISQV